MFFWELFRFLHPAPDSRMNGIWFTWKTQNTRSFGKFLAGNPTRPPALVVWLPVGRCRSSRATSAMSIPFSEIISNVLLEIEILCTLLFLNRNRNSQNSPKRMHPKMAIGVKGTLSAIFSNNLKRQKSHLHQWKL